MPVRRPSGQAAETPSEINQCRVVSGFAVMDGNFVDFHHEYPVGADFALCGEGAVQVCQRAFHLKLAVAPPVPDVVFETFFGREFGHAGEMFGHVLLSGSEHVDADGAVFQQNGHDGRLAVDAQHDGGRFVGNGGNGGHGDAVASCCAVGGDDVYAGGAGGHGVAEGGLEGVRHKFCRITVSCGCFMRPDVKTRQAGILPDTAASVWFCPACYSASDPRCFNVLNS